MAAIYQFINTAILPFWLLLLLAPRWRWTQRICSIGVPLLLAGLYAWLLSEGLGNGDFNSLDGVMKLFSQPRTVVAGWAHYLAFDLFIGAWETRDALRLGISRWLLAPCLVLTLMFGPVGLGLYLILRGVTKQTWEPGA